MASMGQRCADNSSNCRRRLSPFLPRVGAEARVHPRRFDVRAAPD